MSESSHLNPFESNRIPLALLEEDSPLGAVTCNGYVVPVEIRHGDNKGKDKRTVKIFPANGETIESIIRMSYDAGEVISFNTMSLMAANQYSADTALAVFLVWRYGNPGNYQYSYYIKEIHAHDSSNNLQDFVNPSNINSWAVINFNNMVALF